MKTRLEVLEQVLTCTACELHRVCTAPVPFRGGPARICLLGEAPGSTEDAEGRPFIGPSGRLIDRVLTEAGFHEDMGVCNSVSCWPQGTPKPQHIAACRGNKWDQIMVLQPRYLLVLGGVALRSLRPDLAITRGRSRPFLVQPPEGEPILAFATYHPAAALRNGNYEDTMREDVEKFRVLVDACEIDPQGWMQYVPSSCSACRLDAVWWEACGLGWCPAHLPESERPRFEARMALVAPQPPPAEPEVPPPVPMVDVVAWNYATSACNRCSTKGHHYVGPYWDPLAHLCPRCCEEVNTLFDGTVWPGAADITTEEMSM